MTRLGMVVEISNRVIYTGAYGKRTERNEQHADMPPLRGGIRVRDRGGRGAVLVF